MISSYIPRDVAWVDLIWDFFFLALALGLSRGETYAALLCVMRHDMNSLRA